VRSGVNKVVPFIP